MGDKKNIVAFGAKIKVPAWVKFVAQDCDGEVWGFCEKPEVSKHGYWQNKGDKCILLFRRAPSIIDASELLERC